MMISLSRFWKHPARVFTIAPPQPQADRSGIAIGAIVRNEDQHIGEWLRFHEYAGVRAFYLYDDGSSDGTIAAARAAVKKADLTVLPWDLRIADARGRRPLHTQALALAHCISNFGGAYRWMALIDPDEFLVPLHHVSLGAALSELEDVPVVSLPWVMFGRKGHMTPPKGGTLRNFLSRARDTIHADAPGVFNTKPICDPTQVSAVHVHRIRAHPFWRGWNDRGESYLLLNAPRKARQSADRIQLNHYYARSDAELQAKLAKGGSFTDRTAWRSDIVLRRLAAIERDLIEDRAALDFLARRAAETGQTFFGTDD
jgi:hypothetical protein